MIKFNCVSCGEALEAPASLVGKSLQCPVCSTDNAVPDLGTYKFNCPKCGKPFEIPKSQGGNDFDCPDCDEYIVVPTENVFIQKAKVHQLMLDKLDGLEKTGFKYVRWSTAKDNCVCLKCQERHKKLFTIHEARDILNTSYCEPRDIWQGCRCLLLPAKDPLEAVETKKKKGVLRVKSEYDSKGNIVMHVRVKKWYLCKLFIRNLLRDLF